MSLHFLRFLCVSSVCNLLAAVAGAAEPDPMAPPGTESHVYCNHAPTTLRLYVFKPVGWKTGDRRPALVWFFGSGGKPTNGVGWANWATSQGMVGVVPDYRVRGHLDGTRAQSASDARAALRWIEDHSAELGVDPHRIVVSGNSAGAHAALWTAITEAPPGSDRSESPQIKPAALILTSGVSDSSRDPGDENALALSPLHQLDAKMPPVLAFHGDADKAVPYQESVALHAKLVATENFCELITIAGGGHNYGGQYPAWWPRTLEISRWFLEDQGLVSK